MDDDGLAVEWTDDLLVLETWGVNRTVGDVVSSRRGDGVVLGGVG